MEFIEERMKKQTLWDNVLIFEGSFSYATADFTSPRILVTLGSSEGGPKYYNIALR